MQTLEKRGMKDTTKEYHTFRKLNEMKTRSTYSLDEKLIQLWQKVLWH